MGTDDTVVGAVTRQGVADPGRLRMLRLVLPPSVRPATKPRMPPKTGQPDSTSWGRAYVGRARWWQGSTESLFATVLGSVMFDALACQSGCCRGGHSGGDRRRMFFDRQRYRATGATRRSRSQPQLRLCRRSLRAPTRCLHPGNAERRERRSPLQRCRLPVRADAGRDRIRCRRRSASGDRRDLLLVRDGQPGPRAGTGHRARRDHHRNGRRTAQGVPGSA